MQQLWDEFERNKLARETKRGMKEASEQGYRAGGRAPYGYRRVEHTLPEGHRGDREKSRVTLEPDPEQAPVIAEIFHLHADRGLSPKAIADHLNRPDGPSSPRHVDSTRNVRGHWAATTIRAMLRNPVYTGRIVWNRLDLPPHARTAAAPACAPRRNGSSPSRRTHRWSPRSCSPPARPASSSDHDARPTAARAAATCSRDGPLRHRPPAAVDARHGPQGPPLLRLQLRRQLRRDRLLRRPRRTEVDLPFERAPSSLWSNGSSSSGSSGRCAKLARQLKAHDRDAKRTQRHTATCLRQLIVDAERRIKVQVQALEDGLEPEIVTARIPDLRADIRAA